MSLRDINKKANALVVTGTSQPDVRQSLRAAAGGHIARPNSAATLSALRKAETAISAGWQAARIAFVIDATASRDSTWAEAQEIQAKMFESAGAMSMRLIHYGGNEVTAHGWMNDPREIAAIMREVECVGGNTQILDSLRILLKDAGQKPSSVILAGDCYEEDPPAELASQLKSAGIVVHAFQEGDNERATKNFKLIASITGGAFAKFGPDMPLKDLCEGVALKTVGGDRALQRLAHAPARQLLLKP